MVDSRKEGEAGVYIVVRMVGWMVWGTGALIGCAAHDAQAVEMNFFPWCMPHADAPALPPGTLPPVSATLLEPFFFGTA